MSMYLPTLPVCMYICACIYILLCMHVWARDIFVLSLEQEHGVTQDASVELVTRCSLLSGHMTSCDQWCQVVKEYQQRVKTHCDYLARSAIDK